MTYLITEDDPIAATLLEVHLGRLSNARVVTASDGRAAIEMLGARDDFAVIFADLHMPECNGIELFDAIRAMTPQTPIVVVTGAADGVIGPAVGYGQALGLNIIDCLKKPISATQLAGVMEKVRAECGPFQ